MACYGYLKLIFLDLQSEPTTVNYFRVRQKVSALCNQAEVDLEKDEGCGSCDKGMEAGVFGIEGLSRALRVCHQCPQQGLRGGGHEGSQPEKIRFNLPTNK